MFGPLLVTLAPALAPTPELEWALLAVSMLIAGPTLVRGFRRHGRWWLGVAGTAGSVIWTLSIAGSTDPVPEPLTTGVGTILLAGALILNHRFTRSNHCTRGSSEERKDHPARGAPE